MSPVSQPAPPRRPVDSRGRQVNTINAIYQTWANMVDALGWQLPVYLNLLTTRVDDALRKLGDRS